jgi:hypothetical protein
MKIAVCLFGLPRGFEQYKGYMDKFYEGFEVDYYIHSWGDENTLIKLKNYFNPKDIEVQTPIDFTNYFDFEIDMSKNNKGLSSSISALYSIEKVGKILEKTTEKYDFVCLTRSDIVTIGNNLKDIIKKGTFYTSYVYGKIWIISENNDNHVDANFFCSDKQSIINFSSLFSNLRYYLYNEKLPLCHHRLMYKKLKDLNILPEMLRPDINSNCGGWYFNRENVLTTN